MLCFVLLSACGKADKPVTVERTSEMPVQLNEEHKDNITRISGVLQKDEGLYFANSLEESIYSRIQSGILMCRILEDIKGICIMNLRQTRKYGHFQQLQYIHHKMKLL